jgi:hypothetical protein
MFSQCGSQPFGARPADSACLTGPPPGRAATRRLSFRASVRGHGNAGVGIVSDVRDPGGGQPGERHGGCCRVAQDQLEQWPGSQPGVCDQIVQRPACHVLVSAPGCDRCHHAKQGQDGRAQLLHGEIMVLAVGPAGWVRRALRRAADGQLAGWRPADGMFGPLACTSRPPCAAPAAAPQRIEPALGRWPGEGTLAGEGQTMVPTARPAGETRSLSSCG